MEAKQRAEAQANKHPLSCFFAFYDSAQAKKPAKKTNTKKKSMAAENRTARGPQVRAFQSGSPPSESS
jgi:hypothetical protein